ncbi:MAG TPA: CBS domain-containing protein [Symbiobacteriaceae bacterium]|nr:CBS domain-containing protein [Symbiobacteriaceae bacterium]
MAEPKNKLTAREIMTSDVVTVAASSDLAGAMAIMDHKGYSQLPVMRDGKPVALLTETDVRRALAAGRQHLPVAELSSPLPQTAAPETRLSGVLQLLQADETILVLQGENLVGIITYWDLLVLSQPALMVQEVELILRRVVAVLSEAKFGPNWWNRLPQNLRERAEEEHKADNDEPATPEHMLGHTSLWSLIEIFRFLRPDLGNSHFDRLHRVRQLRNMVAHLYVLTDEEQTEIRTLCPQVGDWLVTFLPEGVPLGL